jgi:hypothetical protein
MPNEIENKARVAYPWALVASAQAIAAFRWTVTREP